MKNPELALYTMGRVGTMATMEALREQGIRALTLHNLYPGELSGKIADNMVDYLRRNRTPIVTLVRDPIARNLSAFNINKQVYSQPPYPIEDFFKNFPHGLSLQWLEREVIEVTGIPLYEYSFPWNSGYYSIRSDDWHILVIRTEDLSNVAGDAFEDFIKRSLGVEGVRPVIPKPEAKPPVSVPIDIQDKIYSSKYVKHFYSPEQIEEFRTQWS